MKKWFIPRKYVLYLTPNDMHALGSMLDSYERNRRADEPYGPSIKASAKLYRAMEASKKSWLSVDAPSSNMQRLTLRLGRTVEKMLPYYPKNTIDGLRFRSYLMDFNELFGFVEI